MRYVLIAIGFVLGNYLWAGLTGAGSGPDPAWAAAFERSFFGAGAILLCWLLREEQ